MIRQELSLQREKVLTMASGHLASWAFSWTNAMNRTDSSRTLPICIFFFKTNGLRCWNKSYGNGQDGCFKLLSSEAKKLSVIADGLDRFVWSMSFLSIVFVSISFAVDKMA